MDAASACASRAGAAKVALREFLAGLAGEKDLERSLT
jgi:hypothetical protein